MMKLQIKWDKISSLNKISKCVCVYFGGPLGRRYVRSGTHQQIQPYTPPLDRILSFLCALEIDGVVQIHHANEYQLDSCT